MCETLPKLNINKYPTYANFTEQISSEDCFRCDNYRFDSFGNHRCTSSLNKLLSWGSLSIGTAEEKKRLADLTQNAHNCMKSLKDAAAMLLGAVSLLNQNRCRRQIL
eukprot:3716892-Amphidinium_carterae.1